MSPILDYMTPTPPRVSPWPARMAISLSFYPVAVVGSLYLTWVAGRLCLGHWPRPSLDDPKYISAWVDIAYWLHGLLIIAAPGVLLFHVFLVFVALKSRRWDWVSAVIVLLPTVLWIGSFLLLRWDPLDVGTWYID